MKAPAGIELLSEGSWNPGSTSGEWSPGGCGCGSASGECSCGGSCGCKGEGGGSCGGGKPSGGVGEVPLLPDYDGEIWATPRGRTEGQPVKPEGKEKCCCGQRLGMGGFSWVCGEDIGGGWINSGGTAYKCDAALLHPEDCPQCQHMCWNHAAAFDGCCIEAQQTAHNKAESDAALQECLDLRPDYDSECPQPPCPKRSCAPPGTYNPPEEGGEPADPDHPLGPFDPEKDWCGGEDDWRPVFDWSPEFARCCYEHDNCYAVGGVESDREVCDLEFLVCMLNLGATVRAHWYWYFVRIGGHEFFNYTGEPRGGK